METLDKILADLYDSEINFQLEWIWDGGVSITMADKTKNDLNVRYLGIEIIEMARDLYPDSVFTSKHAKKKEIVTVCGSTRFHKEMNEYALDMTKKGFLVLYPMFAKEEIADLEGYRKELEEQHKQRIQMADLVFVFNKDGYIGQHTQEEIDFAMRIDKEIDYLEPVT